jgi:proline iminopeptidase
MTPDEFTNEEFYLDVGEGHRLYVHDWGNADAELPILFLHGGPGGYSSDRHKTTFIPKTQRVIFFDQRGSGKSTPYGSLEHNTTAYLIEDIEKIAGHLGLERCIVYGGSWGSCLGLAYALKYPKRVHALVLRGIFTGSRAEADWLNNGGYRQFYPEIWQEFVDSVPESHAKDPFRYHADRILGTDEEAAKESAYIYGNTEGILASLDDRFTPREFDDFDPNAARMEVHYTENTCFMPDRYILDNAFKLHMPVWLVQGRYDMVCPPSTAHELHRKLPNSQLIWTTAGHGNDRPNYDVNRSLLLALAGDAA